MAWFIGILFILGILMFIIAHWYWFLLSFIIIVCIIVICVAIFTNKKEIEIEDKIEVSYPKKRLIKYRYEPILVISFKELLLLLETKSLRTILLEKSRKFDLDISENEKQSWNNNEKFIDSILRKAKIHGDSIIAFEWLQKDKRRIDIAIFGQDNFYNKNLVVIELKAWSSDSNSIETFLNLSGHPVNQSLNYYNSVRNILIEKEIEKEIKLNSFVYMYNYNRDNLSTNYKLLFEKVSDFEKFFLIL